ncbi:MAG: GGDEF domain-containing protein [Rubrivivax sp.]|nr:MAG: GGDEF domain-containing protein [Rubrivivax sp.]
MRRDSTTTLDRRTHRPARPSPDAGDTGVPAAFEPPWPNQGPVTGLDAHAASALDAQAESLRGPSPWLRFPTELEAAFHDDSLSARKRHLLLCSLLGILAFAGAAGLDQRLLPDIQHLLPLVRWPLVVAMLLSLALAHRVNGARYHLAEALTSAYALMVAGVIIWSASASHALTAVTHSVAIFAIPVYLCVVALQRFCYAAPTTLACLLGYSLLVNGRTPDEQLIVAENLKMVWLSGLFALLANYLFERNERMAYLLRRQDDARRGQLEQLRNRLRRQSMVDGLTGINNRRFLDHWLGKVWAQRDQHREPLGLLVIDVDFFKAYNDHYGHVQGDLCLQHVARIVSSVAQGYQGHAVRFGGEEFVVMLPGCSAAQALRAGQELCRAVSGANLPHRASGAIPVVSVSVGAASMLPSASDSPQALIALADTALYDAKHKGRNRACGIADGAIAAPLRVRPQASAPAEPLDRIGPSERERQIDTLLESQGRWLVFPPVLERVYEASRRRLRQWQLFIIGMLGVGVFYVLAEGGLNLAPDIIQPLQALQRDFTLGLVAALLLLWLPIRTWQRELVFAMCATTLGVFAVHVISRSTTLTVYSYSVVVFLIPAFSTIGARQPIWFSWMPSVTTVVAYLWLMEGQSPIGELIVQDTSIMLTHSVLLSLFGCYTLERRARTAFLLRLKGKQQRRSLRAMSIQLQAMAMTDALTGLSNRRQFDLDMETCWEHARQHHETVSLLLIDVDCFKRYNDAHGHVQGDQCLRQIGELILHHAGLAQGLPARIGGEEFGIILPGWDTHDSLVLGEQLCRAVLAQGITHGQSSAAPVVTVSIGAATLLPASQAGATPAQGQRQLLSQADEALYRAKANGRNRVMAATWAVI